MKSFGMKVVAGLSLAATALVGVASGDGAGLGFSPPIPYGGGSFTVTPSICNTGKRERHYECVQSAGVCISVPQQSCEQKCYNAQGDETNHPGGIVTVECNDQF